MRWIRSLAALLCAVTAAGALASEASGKPPSVLGGDIGNAIWSLIIFGIVVAVLGKYAWPQVLKALNDRERFIRESLVSAREEREQAAKLLADYHAQLERARVEATAIVDEGRRDAENVRQRILEEARRETSDMTARARREIELATDTAVKELYDRTSEFTVQLASRFLGKALSTEDHRRLVNEAIQEIQQNGRAKLN